jgi:superoxide dismutase
MFISSTLKQASRAARREFSRVNVELAPLPYEISGLEPVISGNLMEYHYAKHHQAYVTNLNNCFAQLDQANADGDLAT